MLSLFPTDLSISGSFGKQFAPLAATWAFCEYVKLSRRRPDTFFHPPPPRLRLLTQPSTNPHTDHSQTLNHLDFPGQTSSPVQKAPALAVSY